MATNRITQYQDFPGAAGPEVKTTDIVWNPRHHKDHEGMFVYENITSGTTRAKEGEYLVVENTDKDEFKYTNNRVIVGGCQDGAGCTRTTHSIRMPETGFNGNELKVDNYFYSGIFGGGNRHKGHIHVTSASIIRWNQRVANELARHRMSKILFGPGPIAFIKRDPLIAPAFNSVAPLLGLARIPFPLRDTFIEGRGLVSPSSPIKTTPVIAPFSPLSPMMPLISPKSDDESPTLAIASPLTGEVKIVPTGAPPYFGVRRINPMQDLINRGIGGTPGVYVPQSPTILPLPWRTARLFPHKTYVMKI